MVFNDEAPHVARFVWNLGVCQRTMRLPFILKKPLFELIVLLRGESLRQSKHTRVRQAQRHIAYRNTDNSSTLTPN